MRNTKISDIVKIVDIRTIKPYANNPRINENAIEPVANSIREFGFRQPIVVDADNTIIAGHTRLEAAKQLGLAEVPVIVADDLTREQVKAYRLADNKTGELADWDLDRLDIELGDIADIDMGRFGFEIDAPNEGKQENDIVFHERISIIIDCRDDEEAQEIYERLVAEGYKCRVSTL